MNVRVCRYVLVLHLLLICVFEVKAIDVNSAIDLKNLLGDKAMLKGTTVTVNSNITIKETIVIKDSSIDLVVLEGVTLTIDKTEEEGEAIGIHVNGNNAFLTIKGNGVIEVKAAKGKKGKDESSGWKVPEKGGNGYNSRLLVLDNGRIQIEGIILKSIPGAGGEGGKNTYWGTQSDSGKEGTAWAIDPKDGVYTVNDMIPYGCYIVNGKNEYYTSAGFVATDVIVKYIKYTASFNNNGGDGDSKDFSYSISDSFTYPIVSKLGYDFKEWAADKTFELINNIPVLADRQEEGKINFTAQWDIHHYAIAYNVEEDVELGDIKTQYTIEDDTYILPSLKKSGYRFMGWYEGNTKITEVPKGAYRDYSLTAKWAKEYKITYVYDQENANPVSTLLSNYINDELPYQLPVLKPKTSNYAFAGWYTEEKYQNKITSIVKNTNKELILYGKLSQSYPIHLNWNVGEVDSQILYYSAELGQILPTRGQTKNGYSFGGWYDNKELTGTKYTEVAVGQTGKKDFYAKWIPIQYAISYDYLYNATLPKDAPKEYSIETSVLLPMPTRQGYSFVGWHAVDESEDWSEAGHGVIPFTFNDQKDQTGNKTFYAEWKGGHILTIQQSEGGKISVKNKTNNQEVESGIAIDKGTSLEISAVVTSSTYKFSELLINGKSYTSVPQTVTMPDTCGLTVSAIFVDGRPSASKPEMSTNPVNTDYIPVGESVIVTLKNTDKDATLYYTVDGSKEKAYTQPFMVSATTAKKMEVKAIARKEGYRDGVTTRQITFGTGKIVITFDLPEGITAVNPDGGEVVSAVATGGTFEFILDVDESVIPSTSQMKVLVNDTLRIYPDAAGVYTLEEQKANVKITIAGVVQKGVTVTLTQTKNGQIVFADDETTATRKVNYGDTIIVKAIPNAGCYFTKWMDGNTDILRQIIVKNDWNLSAVFSANKYVYKVVFPQIQGVTVKTLSAYSNEVEDGGTCKFYLRLTEEYNQSTPVVYANGEKLEPTKDVYSLYYIHTHYSIAVEGIQRNKEIYTLPEHVTGINLETGKSLIDAATLPEAQVMVYANAPDGQVFDKWNDGSKENPRITRASSASHLLPIWKKASEGIHKVDFMLSAGAGVAAVNAGNASAVLKGENFQFKVVLLPQYSQSPVIVKAGDKVLQPVVELRAATELTTRYYTLENLSADTKVEITGLMLNKYKPLVEQTKGGKISVSTSDSVAYGTDITLKATADPGYIFLKWSDGNTLNPYPYKVEDNSSVSAVFIGKGLTVDNESIQKEENAQIMVSGQTLSVTVAEESMLYIWDYKGSLFRNQKIPAGAYTLNLPAGGYLVKVGDMGARKIIIR